MHLGAWIYTYNTTKFSSYSSYYVYENSEVMRMNL